MTNCYSSGSVKAISAGGLIYEANSGKIKNCYSTCNVSGGGTNVGGLVAMYNGDIENCYSTGNLTGNNDSWVGGLVGNFSGGKIHNCYSTCNLSKAYTSGGFIGVVSSNCNITNCYATGNITGSAGGGATGGFVGSITNRYNTFINCYSKGTVSGYYAVGGFIGSIYDDINNINTFINCYSGCSDLNSISGSTNIKRLIGKNNSEQPSTTITNCYANKNMTLKKYDVVTTQPGLQNPLPETVALDGVDGANLPDNPDWKNEIFKDGYEDGTSFDDIWEIGTSGLPILKNMPGNPVQ